MGLVVDEPEVHEELRRWLPILVYEAVAVLEFGGVEDCRRVAEQLSIYVPAAEGDEKSFFRFMVAILYARALALEGRVEEARRLARLAERFREGFSRVAEEEVFEAFTRAARMLLGS